MTPIVTLTTDFGASSHYVAQLKGVLLSAVPQARIVDVTHTIAAGDITQAEVILRSTAFAFPLGSVHLVVVDPGVGTARRPLAVASRGCFFVGPDNGVLAGPLQQPGASAVVLDKPYLFRSPVSATFAGRDIFAPVAAELAAGLVLDDVGSTINNALPSTLPLPLLSPTRVVGQTLLADAFGNLTTNIPGQALAGGAWQVKVLGQVVPFVRTYGDAACGTLIALCGSDGYLEVACSNDSAASRLANARGVVVECKKE